MKFVGKLLMCAVIAAVTAKAMPAQATDRVKVYVPNTKCVIAFSQAFPHAVQKAISLAYVPSLKIEYLINVERLRYGADIFFIANGSGKLRKHKWYVIEVRCGDVSRPKELRNGDDNH